MSVLCRYFEYHVSAAYLIKVRYNECVSERAGLKDA